MFIGGEKKTGGSGRDRGASGRGGSHPVSITARGCGSDSKGANKGQERAGESGVGVESVPAGAKVAAYCMAARGRGKLCIALLGSPRENRAALAARLESERENQAG